MGLTGGSELLVILMFLVMAEVMNASGMSARLISFAASLVGHFRGGMAYVCQLTSALVSGISGSAQADAAIMTPLLVPAMEREGYRARRGRRGGRRRLDQGPDRADLDHVHRLRLARRERLDPRSCCCRA